jgi:predicted secreted protein
MDWFTGIVVFILVWWITLFGVLPWGVRRAEEPIPGTVESAPDRPRLGLKFLVTTGVATIIWLGIFALIKSDLISFRDMANAMRGPGE